MIANTISNQPNITNDPGYICSNYRQVLFSILADSLVPSSQPMYCDIYFSSDHGVSYIFYQTISATTIQTSGGVSLFTFDIQDALQAYLLTWLGTPGISMIEPFSTAFAETDAAYETYFSATSMVMCQCSFRGSTMPGGILTPNGTIPIQATNTSAPVSGSCDACGQSNSFLVLNSTINPSFEDIFTNNLEAWLKTKQIIPSTMETPSRIYTLSNIPSLNYNMSYFLGWPANYGGAVAQYIGDGGQTGVVFLGFVGPVYSRHCTVHLLFSNVSLSMSGDIQIISSTTIKCPSTYYVPTGLADIIYLLTSLGHSSVANQLTDPNNYMFYQVYINDEDTAHPCWFSPLFQVLGGGYGTIPQEHYRLWFQNNFGHFDQISFVRANEQSLNKSSEIFVPYTQNYLNGSIEGTFNTLQKGVKRYNVRASEETTLSCIISPFFLDWLKELFASPFIMMQSKDVDYGRSVDSGFKSLVIQDATFDILKSVSKQDPQYIVTIKVRPGIDVITMRN